MLAARALEILWVAQQCWRLEAESVAFLYILVYIDVQKLRNRAMKTVTFTEFRKNASSLFSDVERGESLLVLRHGKPVAEVSPAASVQNAAPAWKRPGLRLAVKGAALSDAILEDRDREGLL